MILWIKHYRVHTHFTVLRSKYLCRLSLRWVRITLKLSLIKDKNHLSLCQLLWIRWNDSVFSSFSTPSMMPTKHTYADHKSNENSSSYSNTYYCAYSNRLGLRALVGICLSGGWCSFYWRRSIKVDWWRGRSIWRLAVKFFIEVVGIIVWTILIGGIFFCKRLTWTKV